jgi:hypothetical protein
MLLVLAGREVMVICESGGSLENKSGTKAGFQSRSLKAAWYLQKEGFSRVLHVKVRHCCCCCCLLLLLLLPVAACCCCCCCCCCSLLLPAAAAAAAAAAAGVDARSCV